MMPIIKKQHNQTEVNLEQTNNGIQLANQATIAKNNRAADANKVLFFSQRNDARELKNFQDYALKYSLSKNKKAIHNMPREQVQDYLEKLKTQKTEIDRLICPVLL